ncbi:class I SAM-dependent methyltransferase, partial [bacterium]|nr:class I SAM-dependent methyltransferase [bacterium]
MNISEKRISANELWDRIIATKKEHLSIYPVLGQYKSEEFVHLVEEWGCGLQQTKLLKTDLCEEAFGEDQVLFSLEGKEMEVFALDVSENITRIADFNLKGKKLKGNYLTADVRSLPFKDNAFDLILSTSTLDHFVNDSDLKRSLIELKRVLNPAGCMIIALNNKDNPFFYFSLKIGRLLGFVPYPCRFYTLSELKPILKE